jgi:uncharacterized glyoxalase superfamily protein PhnB
MPAMKLDAVSVTSGNFNMAARFYSLLGFTFPAFHANTKHLESVAAAGEVRLMIDDRDLAQSITSKDPAPATHSAFAMKCRSPAEVDATVIKIRSAGFTVVKEPWDAFWGQRYAIVADPDGYMIDLFAAL